MNTHKNWIVLLLVLLVMILLPSSCSLSQEAAAEPDPTAIYISDAVIGTSTADAAKGDQTLIDLKTAQAKATSTSIAIQATQTSRAASVDLNQYATATANAPILAELPFYDVDPSMGYMGWMTATQTLELSEYKSTKFVTAPILASDFVLASDITWNTQYGSSGCGFIFRSDGNMNQPNTYMVIISRFGSGHAVFSAMKNGEMANMHDFFPKDFDHSFLSTNDSTNRVAIVARGNIITIYTNTVKIAEIDVTQPPSRMGVTIKPSLPPGATDEQKEQYESAMEEYGAIDQEMTFQFGTAQKNYEKDPAIFSNGFLGLAALSESGRTQCVFDNTWVWMIGE